MQSGSQTQIAKRPYYWRVPEPKRDYLSENIRRCRAGSCDPNKKREPMKATFIPGVTRNPKYDHVPSRISALLNPTQSSGAPDTSLRKSRSVGSVQSAFKSPPAPMRSTYTPSAMKNPNHVPSRLSGNVRPTECIGTGTDNNSVPIRKSTSLESAKEPSNLRFHRVEYLPCDGICAEENIPPGGNDPGDSGRSSSSSRTSRGVNTEETRIFQDGGTYNRGLCRVRSLDRIEDDTNGWGGGGHDEIQQHGQVFDAGDFPQAPAAKRNDRTDRPNGNKMYNSFEGKSDAQLNRIRNEMSSLKLKDSTIQNGGQNVGPAGDMPHHLGMLPKYLKQRQQEWKFEAEAKKEAEKNKDIPAGHVLMPEHERIETLNTLQQNYDSLVAELNRIPIRMDTVRVRDQKIKVESQLAKLEQAMKIFSRPRVYIKKE